MLDQNDNETLPKRNANAKNPLSQAQSTGLRRTRSVCESVLASPSTTKRRKRRSIETEFSKEDFARAEAFAKAITSSSTASVTRRRTRSLSKQLDLKSKRVTPSPAGAPGDTKFSFESPTESKDKESDSESDDESSRNTPERVLDMYQIINLYPDEDDETETAASGTARSPQKQRARTRKAKKQQQLEQWSKRLERPTTFATAGGKVFDSSTPESLTIDFIRQYGDDYWYDLCIREHPIIAKAPKESSSTDSSCPSTPSKRTKNYSFSSPSSCSSVFSSDKVTPRKSAREPKEVHCYYDIEAQYKLAPHMSDENQKKKLDSQPELTPKMRSILIDWMIELSEHFNFQASTLHLAVTMVDRVLAQGPFGNQEPQTQKKKKKKPSTKEFIVHDIWEHESDAEDSYSDEDDDDDDTRCYLIPRDRFQLLGVTCVWLACKIKETAPPKARQIAYVSDHLYSSGQITRMERRVCNALNFSFLKAPTPHQFLFEYMRASLVGYHQKEENVSSKSAASLAIPPEAKGVGDAFKSVFSDMCHYLLELGRLPYGPTSKNPSLLAAAAVYLARVTLGIPRAVQNAEPQLDHVSCYWTRTLEHFTGFNQDDLEETVLEIHKYQMAAETSLLKAVFNKYKEKTYNRVALKTVPRREDLGFFSPMF